MSSKKLTLEELEAMSYDDIAAIILNESKKTMKINDLFKKICNLLKLSDDEYVNKLPAFFDVLSTDHRFIMLEDGSWDIRTRHSTQIVIDNEDDEEEIILEEEDNDQEDEQEDIFYDEESSDDDTTEDDLKDLVIIDEDEETNG